MNLIPKLFVFTLPFLICCNIRKPIWIPAANESARRMEDERAYQQSKEADLIISDDGLGRFLYLVKDPPPVKWSPSFPEVDLAEKASKATPARSSVVVTMWGPKDQYDYEFKDRVDHIEATLKSIGFKRVIFHLYRCCSCPIFRE